MKTGLIHNIDWVQSLENSTLSDAIIQMNKIDGNTHVLEVGCGLGVLLGEISAKTKAHTTGVVDSWVSYNRAQATQPHVRFTIGLPVTAEEASFDMIIIHQDMVSRLNEDMVIHQLSALLAPYGKLTILADSHSQMMARIAAQYFPSLSALEANEYPDIHDWVEQMKENGYELYSTFVFGAGTVVMNQSFLKKMRKVGHDMMHLMDEREYAEGLMQLEKDYYGRPNAFQHGGATLTVLMKTSTSQVTLSQTA